ncbi:putative protein ycf45, partial [Sesamum angolense]
LLLTQAMKLEVMDRGARRLQVPDPCMKHKVMIEAVDNHMPEVGGLKTVILSDEAARTRNCKKIILERRSAPAFPFLIEMRERDYWVAHRGTPLLWKQIGLNSWRLLFDTSNEIGGDGIFQCFRRLSRSLSFAAINSNRRPHLGAIINQKNSNSHGGDIAAVLLLHFCPAAAAAFALLLLLLLLLPFCSCCCCILLLLMLLLHYYSAAAAAFRPAAAAAATLCCCVLLLLQLRFANAAAVFCCCCSLLRGSNPMVLTGSLAWEGTNSHNCGLIISSIKTNSTKEISNHDQVTLDLGRAASMLFRPGVGKTTVIRGISHVLSYELLKRVIVVDTSNEIGDIKESVSIVSLSCSIWIPDVDFQMQIVVDTSNEIGGDGDIPHPAIGGARRLQVPDPCMKHKVMIEAVDNHMPEIVVDTSNEIGGDGDIPHPAIGGARRLQVPDPCMKHKVMIEAVDNHMPEDVSIVSLSCSIWIPDVDFQMQVGGLKTVILSDEAARTRNCKKIILERRSAPAFPFLIEMRERDYWVAHRGTPLLWKQIGLNSWRPGVGKTTVIRGISHVLSYELLKRVIVVDTSNEIGDIRESVSIVSLSCSIWIPDVDFQMQIVVDTSNEIGGDGDIPHPAIGGARRLQVPDPCMKHKVMIEAVDNHMPEIVVDTSNEIGGDGDIPHPAIGGARRLQVPDPCMKHKVMIEAVDNHMPEVGGLKTVILSDEAARTRNCKKIILERRSAPAFPFLIEMRERTTGLLIGWGCPPSKFPWTYSSKETCYLLEGNVKVYPDGSDEAVQIAAGVTWLSSLRE